MVIEEKSGNHFFIIMQVVIIEELIHLRRDGSEVRRTKIVLKVALRRIDQRNAVKRNDP